MVQNPDQVLPVQPGPLLCLIQQPATARFVGNGKAIAQGEDQGLVKVVFDKKTGQLLGAHMVGSEVTELIQGFVVAMNLETTEEELMHSIFPHPTISETMKEAVLDAYGQALNM